MKFINKLEELNAARRKFLKEFIPSERMLDAFDALIKIEKLSREVQSAYFSE